MGNRPDATKAEFSEQSPLVDFLEESGAECVGDLKDGAKHALGQRIEASAFIGVHQRPIFMCRARPVPLRAIIGRRSTLMNAELRRPQRWRQARARSANRSIRVHRCSSAANICVTSEINTS